MWSNCLFSCDCGFQSVCPLMEKDKRFMESSWWERLSGGGGAELSLVLMGRAMLSKSLIWFSVDGWGCVESLLFTWRQTMVEVMKIMATSLKRSYAGTAALSAPVLQQATANPHLRRRLLEIHGKFRVSLWWGHCSFFLGPGVRKLLFVPPRVCFPVLCEFWGLYGGFNGDLLQEGLCHT